MRLHEINDYLHKHIKEKITVGDIAAQLNFTEGYMSEYMRKASVGFRGMLSYIRANASESLLLNTDKTILEISEECGFFRREILLFRFQEMVQLHAEAVSGSVRQSFGGKAQIF